MKVLLALVLLSSQVVLAQEAQYIWSEENTQSTQIKVSDYINQKWAEPQTITDDKLLNLLPTIAVDSQGNQLAVWTTAQEDTSTVLRFSKKTTSESEWADAQIINSAFQTNLAPSLTFDQNDIAWLAWSANNGDNDEIYAATFNGDSWTQATLVHDANDDADAIPQISMTSSNKPQVQWLRLVNGEVINFESLHSNGHWVSRAAGQSSPNLRLNSELDENQTKAVIEPPVWAKSKSRSTMNVRDGNKQSSEVFVPNN